MGQTSRIKTPLRQHLHRFRLGMLPALSFLACVALTLWLWQRQATIGSVLGEVESKSVTITSGADGRLSAARNDTYWQRGDVVEEGQTVAQLDATQLQAELQMVTAQANKLIADLDAARVNLEIETQGLLHDREQELIDLRLEKERRRVELLRQNARYQDLLAQRNSLQSMMKFYEKMPVAVDEQTLLQQQNQLDQIEKQLEEERRVGKEIENQYEAVTTLLEEFDGELSIPQLDAVLKPIEAQRKVVEAQQEEVQARMDQLVVTSPIDGEVTAVHRLPGEHVRAGDPLLTVSVPTSHYIVSYVRESHRTPIYEGMPVGLRVRGDTSSTEYVSHIERIGPIIEQVPPHQLLNQDTPEWGNPVYIPVPSRLIADGVRPGQSLHVIFHRDKSPDGPTN